MNFQHCIAPRTPSEGVHKLRYYWPPTHLLLKFVTKFLCCIRRKSAWSHKDLKRLWIGNVKLRQEVVNIWIFVVPAKEDSTDWEASRCTKKLLEIALTFSWFFSSVPKLLVDFTQLVHKASKNSNFIYTCRSMTLGQFCMTLNIQYTKSSIILYELKIEYRWNFVAYRFIY